MDARAILKATNALIETPIRHHLLPPLVAMVMDYLLVIPLLPPASAATDKKSNKRKRKRQQQTTTTSHSLLSLMEQVWRCDPLSSYEQSVLADRRTQLQLPLVLYAESPEGKQLCAILLAVDPRACLDPDRDPYNLFMETCRRQWLQESPGSSMREINTSLEMQWNILSDKDRDEWDDKYHAQPRRGRTDTAMVLCAIGEWPPLDGWDDWGGSADELRMEMLAFAAQHCYRVYNNWNAHAVFAGQSIWTLAVAVGITFGNEEDEPDEKLTDFADAEHVAALHNF